MNRTFGFSRRMMLLGVVAAMVAVSPARSETFTTGPLEVALSDHPNAHFQVWTESSLHRIYPASPAGKRFGEAIPSVRNRQVSFQIAVKNLTTIAFGADCSVADADGLNVNIRRVGYVPLRHLSGGTTISEVEGADYLPGLVPDPLFPEHNGLMGTMDNLSFWVTVKVPANVEPGEKNLLFHLKLGEKTVVDVPAVIDVDSLVLKPRHDFPVTHWWRASCIYRWYKVKPWSDDWFRLTKPYIQDMIDHGSDCVFVPLLEERRELFKEPSQMLEITRKDGKYTFDYSVARRFVKMAKECGADMFEWPHLWIYWGVRNPMVVYEKVNGEYKPMWPQDADGFSPEYQSFLKQYLDSLHAFLLEENILDKSMFHLSDEPGGGDIDRYKKARGILKKLAPWMKVSDALSDIKYGKEGVADIPIPLLPSAKAYREAGIPHWVYFCCGPTGPYLNRLMDTPLAKIRMSGFLFYHLNAEGFLHWGYNYWDKIEKEDLTDPFSHGDAEAWPGIPYGDPFVVYPGKDGPIDSIRWEVFAESLQDYALLQTAGVKKDDPMFSSIEDFANFPKTEKWIDETLEKVRDKK